jgi:Uma2 family endonuclease
LSDSETATLVNKKVAADLACGVRLIWIIDPWQQVVHEYKGSEVRRLSQGGVLMGHDVLPGFRFPLSELFAQVR